MKQTIASLSLALVCIAPQSARAADEPHLVDLESPTTPSLTVASRVAVKRRAPRSRVRLNLEASAGYSGYLVGFGGGKLHGPVINGAALITVTTPRTTCPNIATKTQSLQRRTRAKAARRDTSQKTAPNRNTAYPAIRWLNCTSAGFSKKLLQNGRYQNASDGRNSPPIHGQSI